MGKKKKSGKGAQHAQSRRRQAEARGERRRTSAEATGASGSSQATAPATRPAGRPWWERYPDRLERELDAFKKHGRAATVDKRQGRLFVKVLWPINGTDRELVVAYPDLFPYFRFEIFAPAGLGLRKHQNPYAGNLCLLDQDTMAWEIDDTAADILASQLPKLIEANAASETRPDLEIPQAEPVTFYFNGNGLANSIIITPPEAHRSGSTRSRGVMTIEVSTDRGRVRGYVSAIDGSPTSLPNLAKSLRTTRAVRASWQMLAAAPPQNSAVSLVPWLINQRLMTQPRLRKGEIEMFAFAFPEETSYGASAENGWIFIVWMEGPDGLTAALVSSERFDPDVQAQRVPALSDLPNATVVLVGCGGLGAPLAHQLMQMRVGNIVLVDRDVVSVGNAVRWPLGIAAAGLDKTTALAEFGERHYPETQCREISWRIGGSALDINGFDEWAKADEVFKNADVVIDGTAELGVQLFLSDLCRDRKIPLITVESREGAFGGIVVRYRPDRPGCYNCFKLHQRDGRFEVIGDEEDRIQPRGCATPTFAGASFDLVPLSVQAARMVAQTLVGGERLPDTGSDIAVFRARDGVTTVPRWDHAVLEPHPECVRCAP